jgi:CubicO group peptidase (beta-lactamase class C family)
MLFVERDAGAFAAAKPVASPPGAHFRYSSGTTNVVTRALRALHADEAERFSWPRRALFEPLGMRGAVFELDASGTFVGSSFLYAPARDWLRFGLLYANDGVFAGRRLLSSAWIRACLTPAPAASRGEYGLHWWLNRGPGGDAGSRRFPRLAAEFFSAEGYEGQIVGVDPTRDVIVVRLGVTKDREAFDAREFVADVLEAFPRR